MKISNPDRLDEIREAHLDLSRYDWQFREIALQYPEYQNRSNFRIFDHEGSDSLLTFRLQSWPTFVRRSKLQEFAQVSVTMSNLIRSIPQKVFRGNPEAMARFYGYTNTMMIEFLLDAPNGIAGALSRGDFIYGPDGFRCIEFNIIPMLGGWESGILAEMHLYNPLTARLIAELGISLSHVDTTHILFSHLLQEARQNGLAQGGEVNVGLLAEGDSELLVRDQAFRQHLQKEYQTVLEREGGELRGHVFVCKSDDLATPPPGIVLQYGERPVHAVIELTINTDQRVFRCFKAGGLNLYNGPLWRLLSDKRNIALLSDESLDTDFTPEERRFLSQYVPWTRAISNRQTTFRGERVSLTDLLESRRLELVLKNAQLYGGKEVYVGVYTSPSEWSDVIRKALDENCWVAQEYVPSRPYLYQNGDHGCSPHNVIWGPFVFGQRYSGTILRMQPIADQSVVNLSLTATEGLIFEVEDD